MENLSAVGIYLLGFVAFSYTMYSQNKIVKIQRKMLAQDMDIIGRAQDSLNRIIQISCMVFDNPDKYPEEIKKFKNGLEELKKYSEELKEKQV